MPISVKNSLLSLVLIVFLAGSTVAESQLAGDLNKDYRVNFKDLRTLAQQWLHPGCFVPGCIADLDFADGVNMVDLALLANNWLMEEPHLVISEFMASNASNKPPLPPKEGDLLDGNGESSDWIEIYNPSGASVSLDGWYLTDSDANLTMWQFPDGLEILAGEFLVVFASGKTYEENQLNYPYLDSLDYYHTNFELNQAGDYLALVAPGSTIVVHEYRPEFPEQLTDISYGLAQYATKLVPTGATASYYVPESGDAGLGTSWTEIGFDDSVWDTGETGLGFGAGAGTTAIALYRFDGDCSDSAGSHDGIPIGIPTYGAGQFDQAIDLDSAFGEYVWTGKTASDLGLSGNTPRTITAWVYTRFFNNGGIFEMGEEGSNGRDFSLRTYSIADNQWRVQYWGSSFDIDFTYDSKDKWVHFAHVHDGTATRIYADGELIVPDTPRTLSTADTKTFNIGRWRNDYFNGLIDDLHVYDQALSQEDIQKIMDTGMIITSVEDMLGVNASLWIRTEFEIEDPTFYDILVLRMKYEDGFVAYLNGQPVTSRNAPSSVQWDSTADSDRPIEDSSVFEEINLMAYMHLLQAGTNVLAIQGLNDDKDDGDFLILPELVAARSRLVPQYFTTATPNTFNISGAMGVVDEVWFSHKRGFYEGIPGWHFDLTLSNGTNGAEIRYTDDGSLPTATHGLIYNPQTDPPIEIDKTTTIRAVAVKPGWLDSAVETHTYIFLDKVIQQPTNPPGFPTSGWGHAGPDYEMDPAVVFNYSSTIKNDLKAVPTLSLAMDVNDWFKTGGQGIYPTGELSERAVSAELIFPDGTEGFQIDCAVMIVGGTSVDRWKMDKLSMRLKFQAEWGPTELRYPVFGDKAVDVFDTLVVDARMNNSWAYGGSVGISRPGLGQRDVAQYTRDQFASDIQNAMGGYGGQGRHVHLYLNGLYWGLYWLHERPDEHFAAAYFGGDDDDYDVLKHNSSTVIHGTDDSYDEMFAVANGGLFSNSQYLLIQEYLDVPGLIDYMLMNFYIGNTDWDHQNWYATCSHVDPAGRWRYHSWDAEHCLEGLYDNVTGDNNSGAPSRLHQQLRQNAEYKILFADHIHRHFFNNGVLTPEGATALYNVRLNEVGRAVVGESARWGDNRRSTPYTRDIEWITERNWLLNTYFPQRTGEVLTEMWNLYPDVNAPVFNINGSYQHGGEVSAGDELTMDNPNGSGTIWYTVDGSDPRQPLTGNPVGTPYAPVTLNKSTHVKARVRDGITWSALNEAIFAIGLLVENLRITEIMFNPRNTGNPNDPNEEFIELKNTGLTTLNLNLVKFTEGIHFTFPDMELDPDECVVVVRDESAFEAKYGTSVKMAGQYTGSLANDGERIQLVDAIGRTILDFEYEDGWRPITDGDGFSLTMIDPGNSSIYGSDRGLVAHWKFDDGTGSTAIDSAGTNNGTLYGDKTWTTGRIDGALSFDGDGDYVEANAITALAGDNLTAQAWICVDEFAEAYIPVLMQRDSGYDGCYFYVVTSAPTFYIYKSLSYVQVISPETINADQWYHVAATNDGSNLKLYVDGRLKDSITSTGFTGVSDNAYIGGEPFTPLYYTGLIDDVRIYERPVSESEFQDIMEPMRRWSRQSSWRACVYRNGSPGWDDSSILPNTGAVVINEVMSHSNAGPDWIELHNTTSTPIDIGGWFLSDNNRDEPNLMKYKIADGTTIASNGYKVFYQDTDFNNPGDPGCNVPFALSENGEEVCLSSHLDPNGFWTGYREVEEFGASQTNVSFGRYYKPSTDNFNFVAMDYNTPDTNNANPKVGPVVINEIMYNPPTGNQNEEYIELHNITGTNVTLYRTDKLAPWKFTDGIDYTFSGSSPFAMIPANGYMLLVKDLASFITRYGSMPLGVQVIDDYSGWLSNAGERLQIGMPGDTDEFGTRHYIRIDRVTYSDGSHPEDCPGGVDLWPTGADGLGKSLSRKDPNDYGNDVINWEAADLSPGTANP
ncbi:MAG: lamin tail domain-containing protein [Sedimentisphaerales bacterium]